MNTSFKLAALLVLLATLAGTAGAFTADRLEVVVAEGGDATVEFQYRMGWLESAAVFVGFVRPEMELKRALEAYSGKEVMVSRVDAGVAAFEVDDFAHVRDGTVYTTPALSFEEAGTIIRRDYSWLAGLIETDFSPSVTAITFPDGFQETFYDQVEIPRVEHAVQ